MTKLPKTITWHGKRMILKRDEGFTARYHTTGIDLKISRDEDGSNWGVEVDMCTDTCRRLGSLNAGVDHYSTLGAALNALDLLLRKAAP